MTDRATRRLFPRYNSAFSATSLAGRRWFRPSNHHAFEREGARPRIESAATYTTLLTLPVTQVTAFAADPDGRLYAATGDGIARLDEFGFKYPLDS